jgi:hypothetical protein
MKRAWRWFVSLFVDREDRLQEMNHQRAIEFTGKSDEKQ